MNDFHAFESDSPVSAPVTTTDLKARLELAHERLIEALAQADLESLPSVVMGREADLALLVSRLGSEDGLSDWARGYLARDRELLAQLIVARDAAEQALSRTRRSFAIHRSYVTSGLL